MLKYPFTNKMIEKMFRTGQLIARETKHVLFPSPFGRWGITKELYEFICDTVTPGRVIVELGSGVGTKKLAERYRMVSVEHDLRFLGRYDTEYIFAPITDGWYDAKMIQRGLPQEYDLLLIDGPPKVIGRAGLVDHFGIFRSDVPVVFDDLHRPLEQKLVRQIAGQGHYSLDIHRNSFGARFLGERYFGVLVPLCNGSK